MPGSVGHAGALGRAPGPYLNRAVAGAPGTSLPAQPGVVLFNGQSNMAATVPVLMGHSALTQYLGAEIQGWSDASSAFVQVVDGTANTRANTGGGGTGAGPGLGQIGTLLARRIADASALTVKTFALAYTSQNIDYFRPGSATMAFYEDGTQHATLNNYDLLKSMVDASGETVELIVFCQGEANAGATQSDYYDKLKEIISQWAIDYPSAHVLLITTIGDANGDISGQSILGVRAAQSQLASENPHVHLIDTSDMEGKTAWFGREGDLNHYTTYAGYEEVAERCWATLQGTTRAAVADVASVYNVIAWDHFYQYHHSIDGSGNVTSWWDRIGSDSLGGITASGSHVAYDEALNGRSVVEFERANSEGYLASGLAERGGTFSVWCVAKTDLPTTSNQYLWELRDDAATNRVALILVGSSAKPMLFYMGVGTSFADAPAADTDWHTWALAVDDANLEARLYRDGVLVDTLAIDGSLDALLSLRFYVGTLSDTSHLDGRVAEIGFKAGHALSDQEASDLHAWAAVEYGL